MKYVSTCNATSEKKWYDINNKKLKCQYRRLSSKTNVLRMHESLLKLIISYKEMQISCS